MFYVILVEISQRGYTSGGGWCRTFVEGCTVVCANFLLYPCQLPIIYNVVSAQYGIYSSSGISINLSNKCEQHDSIVLYSTIIVLLLHYLVTKLFLT